MKRTRLIDYENDDFLWDSIFSKDDCHSKKKRQKVIDFEVHDTTRQYCLL